MGNDSPKWGFQEILDTAERDGRERNGGRCGRNLIATRELVPGWTLQSVNTQSQVENKNSVA
jgi:hypothetical protein